MAPYWILFTNLDTPSKSPYLVLDNLRLLYDNVISVKALVFEGLANNLALANLLGAA